MLKKIVLLLTFLSVLISGNAFGAIIVYDDDLAGFTTATGLSVTIDFDSIIPGTDISGNTINGVTFSSPTQPGYPNPNTLDVVVGSNTTTPSGVFTSLGSAADLNQYKLIPTSGSNVLSPGGTELVGGSALGEHDSIQLDFVNPVYAFGIDVLFQSYDFNVYTRYIVYDSNLNPISSGRLKDAPNTSGGGSPADSVFIGFISDDSQTDISRIAFIETDGTSDWPDSNIGYDSIRIASNPAPAVPISSTLFLFGFGILSMAGLRR